MAKPNLTVEIEVDPDSNLQPFFTLDDPEQGVLDNTEYTLGGLTFADVTENVAAVSVSRGISRELDRTTAGNASVALNNDTRLFDPLNTSSPYSEQLLPHRQLRIKADGTPVFLGIVEDWNLQYDLTGNNLSIANASDKFTLLAQQTLDEIVVPAELTNNRMTRILDRPEVDWSSTQRSIDEGSITCLAGTVALGTNALEYLQYIAYTEDGTFFIGKDGYVVFQNGLVGPSTATLITFSSEGDGVPFNEIEVVYGSELLYNRVEVDCADGITVVGDSTTSQTFYGITTLTRSNYLGSSTDGAILAVSLLNKYDEPEYRFERILTDITDLPSNQQQNLLNAEITDVAKIKFQPNNTGDVIEKYAQIIGIKHSIDSKRHKMEFRFRTLDFAPFVLDDPVFGTMGGSIEAYDENTITYDGSIVYDGTESTSGNRLG